MIIGGRTFDFGKHFYMMGIINVTPDSFSDGGKYNDIDQALRHAGQLIAEGADILDVGGESTRPGHVKITEGEEIERVCPIIEKLKITYDVPVSLDTYKSKVASAGIKAGADMINDIWGLKWDCVSESILTDTSGLGDAGRNLERISESDLSMAEVIAQAKVPCCLMHNRNTSVEYENFIEDVLDDMRDSINIALKAGINKDNIILDPGIGFAKDLQQNLYMMNQLKKLCKLGYPVLLGTSRKSMIGLTLDLPVEEREEGTIATSVLGYQSGCRIFRVHNVKANIRALKMAEAILNAG